MKIKKRDELRRREQKREVPVWQVGNYVRHLVAERHVRSPILAQQVLAQEIAPAPDDPGWA
ncbi:hypothetical protein [Mesorhizobium sp. M1136]|uniref:hypothetical protein n=1 Tax=Mesorhizobium sp. M1136 TaxID=2957059 RepID=UPI00333AB535